MRHKQPKFPITICLTEVHWQKLKQIAEQDDRPPRQLARLIIEKWIDKDKQTTLTDEEKMTAKIHDDFEHIDRTNWGQLR